VARTAGSRNENYDEARLALAGGVKRLLVEGGAMNVSLRQMAEAAGTSVATLKHYFGDRAGVLRAVMEAAQVEAAPFLAMASTAIEGDVKRSLLTFLQRLKRAWERFGAGAVLGMGLSAGLADRTVGPRFVQHLLEPSLHPAEVILARHVTVGDLEPLDVRFAALELMSPVLLGLLHQVNLLGVTCRPLDLDALIENQVACFVRAHPPTAGGRGAK
jgi:AcrR family transcriptional regulator